MGKKLTKAQRAERNNRRNELRWRRSRLVNEVKSSAFESGRQQGVMNCARFLEREISILANGSNERVDVPDECRDTYIELLKALTFDMASANI